MRRGAVGRLQHGLRLRARAQHLRAGALRVPGWWCGAEKDQLLQAMGRELDPKKRYALWERVQAAFYADAARIRFGDYFRLDARRKEAQGYEPGPYMHFWNVWLDTR